MATTIQRNIQNMTQFTITEHEPMSSSAWSGSCSVTNDAKWGWSLRSLDRRQSYQLVGESQGPPRAGDVAVVEVVTVGHHTRMMTTDQERLRLYAGDKLVTVFGNRYATDAFEATVQGVDDLHMLTDAGMVGSVRSKHSAMKSPTRFAFLGYLADQAGQRINLKRELFRPTRADRLPRNTLLVIGSGMNSGKTTTAAKVTKALVDRGTRVSACKLTGSVCNRDLSELRSTGAHDVRDFSCYGFPSTYLADKDEIVDLFYTMLSDAQAAEPEVVVMEVADGMLQRETRMILEDAQMKRSLMGILLSAHCAPSALYGVAELQRLGHDVIGVSGLLTSSPLFVREFTRNSNVPVGSSAGNGNELAELVTRQVALSRLAATGNSAASFAPLFMDTRDEPVLDPSLMTRPGTVSCEAAA